jgi:photosystem II stability/assembly factor-like uncharacterized protein
MKNIIVIISLLFITQNAIPQFVQTNGPEGGIVRCLASNSSYVSMGTDNNDIFITNNNGDNWFKSGLPPTYVYALAYKNNELFAGTAKGLYYTSNNGVNWNQRLTNGIFSLFINGSNIFAGSTGGGGVYYSSNNGINWSQLNNGLPTSLDQIRGFCGIGSNIYLSMHARGVYKTTNNGINWVSTTNDLPDLWVWTITSNNLYLFVG